MKVLPLALEGAFLVEIEPISDDRGFFARTYCVDEFARHGLDVANVQSSISFNHLAGTMRGMHYQGPPSPETKLVRCTRGAVYDVIVDMRAESPTYLQHVGVELTGENHRALYIPPYLAHGFLTMRDETEVVYQINARHDPAAARGVRYDDERLGIRWPRAVAVVADKDLAWPSLER
jgi:dTDP-4-dehydrorhamnose 3,5-epimerase